MSAQQQTPVTHSDRAYECVKRDIIRGVWPPGSRLGIKEVSERYGIGASPVREALSRLTGEDFVHGLGNRGFRVPPIDLADLWDVTNTRILIETAALRESIDHGDDGWEAEVVAAHYRLKKLDERPAEDFAEWEACNERFHLALVAACPSRWLRRMRVILYDQHRRYRFLSTHHATDRDIVSEHQALRDAALAHDADAAVKVLRVHVERTAQAVERILRAKGSTPDKPAVDR